jgi:hypothetical protein
MTKVIFPWIICEDGTAAEVEDTPENILELLMIMVDRGNLGGESIDKLAIAAMKRDRFDYVACTGYLISGRSISTPAELMKLLEGIAKDSQVPREFVQALLAGVVFGGGLGQ